MTGRSPRLMSYSPSNTHRNQNFFLVLLLTEILGLVLIHWFGHVHVLEPVILVRGLEYTYRQVVRLILSGKFEWCYQNKGKWVLRKQKKQELSTTIFKALSIFSIPKSLILFFSAIVFPSILCMVWLPFHVVVSIFALFPSTGCLPPFLLASFPSFLCPSGLSPPYLVVLWLSPSGF